MNIFIIFTGLFLPAVSLIYSKVELEPFKDRPVVQASRHGLKLRYTMARATKTVHLNLCKGNLEPRTKKKVCFFFSICTFLKYFSRF